MDILSWINRINNQHGTESVSNRFNTTQWLRPGFQGAGLVDHGPAGVRQGYGQKDKYKLSADMIKRIKDNVTLKRGQRWNFFDAKTNPKGHTFGIKKGTPSYDAARYHGGKKEAELIQYQKDILDPEWVKRKYEVQKIRYEAKKPEILEYHQERYQKPSVKKAIHKRVKEYH